MKKISMLTLLATGSLTFVATAAQAEKMSSQDIQALVSGKQVVLKTSIGKFPLRYSENGNVTGNGAGTGIGRFYNPKETGKWWSKNDNLCQQFPTWYKGSVQCFAIERTGPQSIKWVRNDGYSGTATVSD